MENETKMAYMRPPGGGAAGAMDEHRGPSKGFVVREAPWTTGSEKVSPQVHLVECRNGNFAVNIESLGYFIYIFSD